MKKLVVWVGIMLMVIGLNAQEPSVKTLKYCECERHYYCCPTGLVLESIKIALKEENLQDAGNAMNNLASKYFYASKRDSVDLMIDWIESSGVLADTMTNGLYQQLLGFIMYQEGNYDSSVVSYKKSIALYEQLKDTNRLSTAFMNLSTAYAVAKDRLNEIDALAQAINFAQVVNDSVVLADCHFNMGLTMLETDDLKGAREHYTKALDYITANNDRIKGYIYLGFGDLYTVLKDVDSARVFFKKALAAADELGEEYLKMGVLNNFGQMENAMGSDEKAVEYLLQVTSVGEELISPYLRAHAHTNLGKAYGELEKFALGIEEGKKGLQLSKDLNYLNGVYEASYSLASTYELSGDYKNAVELYKKADLLQDSLAEVERIEKADALRAQFNAEQSKKENRILKLENESIKASEALAEQQKRYWQMGVAITALFVLVMLFLIFRIRKTNSLLNHQKAELQEQKNQLEQAFLELTKRDEEKELLLKEIHHRVKNNLQVVSSLLELQAKKAGEDTQTAFADGQSRVKAMALIHEKLYRNEDISSIDFEEYANQLANQISSLYEDTDVELEIAGNNCQFDIDTAVPLGLMLNELITNAFKYAFKLNGGVLKVEVHPKGDEGYELVVADNGDGMPDDFDLKKAKSLGLRLVNRLSRQLYGKAEYENINGAKFSITFKDTNQRKLVA